MAPFEGALLISSALIMVFPGLHCKNPEKNSVGNGQQRQLADHDMSGIHVAVPCVAGTPQFPNYVQPMKLDPNRILGKWYFYSEWYPDMPTTPKYVNVVGSFTNILNGKLTLYPGSNTPAIPMEQQYGYVDPQTKQCASKTWAYLSYLTVEGQCHGLGFNDNGTTNPDLDSSSILATDYDNYVLFYECYEYDLDSGICASPYVNVLTRMRPDKLEENAASNIAGVVSQKVGLYCFNLGMSTMYQWMPSLSECPTAKPNGKCYTNVRQAYLNKAGAK